MVEKSAIILRALLENYQKDSWETLLDPLDQKLAQQVRGWDLDSKSLKSEDFRPEKLFEWMHYSWLKPIIEEFPPQFRLHLLSVLPKKTASKLAESLDFKLIEKPFSKIVLKFFKQQFYQRIASPHGIPNGLLEKSPLKPFIEMSKREILEVIDLFSLYDLAKEVRQIVDTAKLKRIYACLNAKERKFLHRCIQSKEHLTTVKWHIERWDGNEKKFLRLIHQKGLLRLGYALSGQRPQLIWMIMHKLDVGRAEILKKYINKDEVKGVTASLIKQLLNVVQFLQKEVNEP